MRASSLNVLMVFSVVFVLAAGIDSFAIPTLCIASTLGQSNAGPESATQIHSGTISVKPKQAEQNLIQKVAPTYPPIARDLRLQGKVIIQVVISKTGFVESASVVSGHPMLVQAAMDAVKQWQYKPFLVAGQPITASTEVEVPFSLGVSDADYQAEEKNSQTFFRREDECRGLLKAKAYPEAQGPCTSLVQLAEKLPKVRQMERMSANELAGHSVLYQFKFDEALGFFQTEVAVGEASLEPWEAELGYAYHHMGLTYYGMGDLQKAQAFYEHSESTLRAARERMDNEPFKTQYAKDIQGVLREYIVLLRQTGQDDVAAQAQKRADAIAQEIHPAKTP